MCGGIPLGVQQGTQRGFRGPHLGFGSGDARLARDALAASHLSRSAAISSGVRRVLCGVPQVVPLVAAWGGHALAARSRARLARVARVARHCGQDWSIGTRVPHRDTRCGHGLGRLTSRREQ